MTVHACVCMSENVCLRACVRACVCSLCLRVCLRVCLGVRGRPACAQAGGRGRPQPAWAACSAGAVGGLCVRGRDALQYNRRPSIDAVSRSGAVWAGGGRRWVGGGGPAQGQAAAGARREGDRRRDRWGGGEGGG